MTTSEFISMIVRDTNGALTRQEALQLTDLAQTELLGINTFFTRVLPTPTLTTFAGQLVYPLPPGWRSVTRGYTVVPNAYQALYGPYLSPSVPFTDYPVPFNCPQTSDRSVPLTIVFDFDPGVQVIYLDVFAWPNALTSESIQLQIPANFQATALRSRVLMMNEQRNFGNSVYWVTQYEKTDLPAWKAYSSQGAKTRNGAAVNARIYG